METGSRENGPPAALARCRCVHLPSRMSCVFRFTHVLGPAACGQARRAARYGQAFLAFFLHLPGWIVPVFAASLLMPAQAAELPLVRVGVLAFRSLEQTRQQWTPTIERLRQKIPAYRFEAIPLAYPDMDQAVQAGQLDFVLTNPEHYVLLRARYGLAALATLMPRANGHPVTRFGGVIFCRADDRRLNSLEDIPGRRIASPSPQSLGGYLMQRWTMVRRGIGKEGEPVPGDIYFTGVPHDRVVVAVLAGEADVGFVRTGVLEAMAQEGKLDLKQVRVLNPQPPSLFPQLLSTETYPEWPFAALPKVEEPLAKSVTQALLTIEPEEPAAIRGKYYGFSPPGDYSSIEAIMVRLRLHPDYQDTPLSLTELYQRHPLWFQGLAAFVLLGFGIMVYLRRMNCRLAAALAEARRLALRDVLLDSLGEGVCGIDAQGCITFINPAALKTLGYTATQVQGHEQHSLFHHHYPDGRPYPASECPIYRTLADGQLRHGEEWFFRRSGAGFPVSFSVTPILADSRVEGAVVVFRDITERKATEEKIRSLAFYDPLTGLPNRRLLLDRLGQSLIASGRSGRFGAVLFIDLDNFKQLNDSAGHDVGDQLLGEVAARLQGCVREGDTVSRFGGDEFVIILSGLGESLEQARLDAGRIGEKIRLAVNAPCHPGGQPYQGSPSIGITLFKGQGESVATLLRQADIAMYEAKGAGKNAVRFFMPGLLPVMLPGVSGPALLQKNP